MLLFASTLFMIEPAAADAPPPPPIVNGERTSDFIQVGAIMAYSDNYGGYSFCSATLIHEKWAVTAAHCLEAASEYYTYGQDIYFVMGENLYTDGGIFDYDKAINWILHPDYGGNNGYISADIGLMELETGFPDVEPIALNEDPPSDAWGDVIFDYVGWGITADNQQDSGIKRTAAIPYYDADEQFIYAYDSQANLCSGDSGGAGLIPLEDGSYAIAGVNSFVFGVQSSQTSCVGGGSGATRIDSNFDWIREYVPEPPPPVVEEPEEESEGDNVDPDSKEGILTGCSTINAGSSSMLTLSVLALLWGRRED
ncbi:MAG: S1 family peptidase [Myxococcota bacterium]